MIGGAAPGRIDGLSDGGPWPRCSLRRHQLSAATMPGTDAPGMVAAESWCRRREHLGQGPPSDKPSILPGAAPPIMLRPDADGAVAERQLCLLYTSPSPRD